MKYDETAILSPKQIKEAQLIGSRIADLRHAYGATQSDAAARAALSRSTAVLIEKGDPSRTLGQIMRYVHAIAPGVTLAMIVEGNLPALAVHREKNSTKRVRKSNSFDPKDLDF